MVCIILAVWMYGISCVHSVLIISCRSSDFGSGGSLVWMGIWVPRVGWHLIPWGLFHKGGKCRLLHPSIRNGCCRIWTFKVQCRCKQTTIFIALLLLYIILNLFYITCTIMTLFTAFTMVIFMHCTRYRSYKVNVMKYSNLGVIWHCLFWFTCGNCQVLETMWNKVVVYLI